MKKFDTTHLEQKRLNTPIEDSPDQYYQKQLEMNELRNKN